MVDHGYVHKLKPGMPGAPILFVLHGTGGDENQFFGFGAQLLPEATVVSPRGDVSEHGAAASSGERARAFTTWRTSRVRRRRWRVS